MTFLVALLDVLLVAVLTLKLLETKVDPDVVFKVVHFAELFCAVLALKPLVVPHRDLVQVQNF